MSSVLESPEASEPLDVTVVTLTELATRFGPIPVTRIRISPAPGTATERDLIAVNAGPGIPCELIDGTLVEKAVSAWASRIALRLAILMGALVEQKRLGFLLGEAGFVRLPNLDGRWRSPDLAFYRATPQAEEAVQSTAYPELSPALAVEVLSPGNSDTEINGKVDEYFRSGTELVWVIDPETKTAKVYAAVDRVTEIDEAGTLDGGDVLPGFSVKLGTLFER
ncbi:MAG: Uma2 family endonuclease [Planctomycetota bacterium]